MKLNEHDFVSNCLFDVWEFWLIVAVFYMKCASEWFFLKQIFDIYASFCQLSSEKKNIFKKCLETSFFLGKFSPSSTIKYCQATLPTSNSQTKLQKKIFSIFKVKILSRSWYDKCVLRVFKKGKISKQIHHNFFYSRNKNSNKDTFFIDQTNKISIKKYRSRKIDESNWFFI